MASQNVAHGRGGRERDVVGAGHRRAQDLIQRLVHRLIEREHIDLGSARAERVRQHIAGLRGPRDQGAVHRDVRRAPRPGPPPRTAPARDRRSRRGRAAQRPCRGRSPPRARPRARAHRVRRRRGARTAPARHSGSSDRRGRSARDRVADRRARRSGSRAPRSRARRAHADACTRPLAWARARVTATLTPNSGRCSNQASRSLSAATGPNIAIAGAVNCSCSARAAIVPSVACRVRWSGKVARRTSTAGSCSERPPAINRCVIGPRYRTPV